MTTEDRDARLRAQFESWWLLLDMPAHEIELDGDGAYETVRADWAWEGFKACADTRAEKMAGLLREAIEIIDYYASDSEDTDILGRLRTAADHAEPAKPQGERT